MVRRSSGYHTAGVCGLHNLGNTCFMNSALQCLSNTPALTNYILDGLHVDEINRDNPLGMGGQMAEEYAALVRNLWDAKQSAIAPREFKVGTLYLPSSCCLFSLAVFLTSRSFFPCCFLPLPLLVPVSSRTDLLVTVCFRALPERLRALWAHYAHAYTRTCGDHRLL